MMWLDGLLGLIAALGRGFFVFGGSGLTPDGGHTTGGSGLTPDGGHVSGGSGLTPDG